MPCYDDRAEEDRLIHKERLDKATRAACDALMALEILDELSRVTAESRQWWQEHKQLDAGRRSQAR